jgi:adenylate cyclase
MADIFVSYARLDKTRVAPLVAALETHGWSVWWDPEVTPGQEFDRQISAELDAAKAVIVVWSPQSVDSRWVRGEAREAADRGVLVPVRFENARLPIDALPCTRLISITGVKIPTAPNSGT